MLKKILVIALFTVGLQANNSRDEVLLKLVKDSQKDEKTIGLLQQKVDRSENRIAKLEYELEKIKMSLQLVPIGREAVQRENKKLLLVNMESPQFITASKPINKKGEVSSSKKLKGNAIITAWTLNSRSKPDKKAYIIHTYKMGDIIHIYETKNEWCKTRQGYVKAIYTKKLSNNSILKVSSIKNNVNIRKTPYFSKNTISQIPKNHTFEVYSVLFNKEWYKLKDSSGYVHKNVVKVSK